MATQKEINRKADEKKQSVIDCWNSGVMITKEIARITGATNSDVSKVITAYLKTLPSASQFVQTEEEMMRDACNTLQCDTCGFIGSHSVGVKSSVTNHYYCVTCLANMTIQNAINMSGDRLDEFLKEIC